MIYIKRALADTVRRAIATFPAVLVTGARQAGKTTLLRTDFGKTHQYISLERPDVRARAQSDPVAFFDEIESPVILDEIQYTPELLHHIKERIDEDRAPGQWLLTGSQSFSLMRGVSQSLAGRVAVLSLDPLSTAEFLEKRRGGTLDALLKRTFSARSISRSHETIDLADWLLRGAYPEPRLNKSVDRQLWCSSYVQTYLERDVRDLVQVADLSTFARFLTLLGSRTGMILNLAELAREVGVSGPTAKRWLSVLETSQMIYLLRPYYRNFGKRIRKRPKLCLLDTGLATFLLGLHTSEAVLHGPSLGALMETAVIGEWVKAFRQRGEQPAMYYWQPSGGGEVDLIIDYGGSLHGIEVKATATPSPRQAESVARWMEAAGPTAKGALACNVPAPTSLRPNIRAIPWHLSW